MSFTITLLYKKEIIKLPLSDQKPPAVIHGQCKRCGKCCLYYGCPAFDQATNACKVYYNRPIACRQAPACAAAIAEVKCTGYKLEKVGYS